MCRACPSAYGGGSSYSIQKKNVHSSRRTTIQYDIKERLSIVIKFFRNYPGYTLAIGTHDNFIKKIKQCKKIEIHNTFYNPLISGSEFTRNISYDIQLHINEINKFLNNSKRPFNAKREICMCDNNTSMNYTSVGLVLLSTVTPADFNVLSLLEKESLGTTNWTSLPLYINK